MSSPESPYGRNSPRSKAVRTRPADWKLPPGVAPGTWDYTHSPEIAMEYDAFLAGTPLLTTDLQWVADAIPPPTRPGALIADLGCGTGRTSPVLASLGYRMLGIDLSQAMLIETSKRASSVAMNLPPDETPAEQIRAPLCVRANLVTLECLRDQTVDHALCLFSTLGMVRGRANRRTVLGHVRRILRPDGRFLLHVHHRWAALYDPGGWKFLLSSYWKSLRNGEADFGDRIYGYRGLPNMFLHSFSRAELRRDLRSAGLQVVSWNPLSLRGERQSQSGGLSEKLLAGGFMVVAAPRS